VHGVGHVHRVAAARIDRVLGTDAASDSLPS